MHREKRIFSAVNPTLPDHLFKKMLVSYREADAAEAGRIKELFVEDPDDQSLGGTVGHPDLLRERPVES